MPEASDLHPGLRSQTGRLCRGLADECQRDLRPTRKACPFTQRRLGPLAVAPPAHAELVWLEGADHAYLAAGEALAKRAQRATSVVFRSPPARCARPRHPDSAPPARLLPWWKAQRSRRPRRIRRSPTAACGHIVRRSAHSSSGRAVGFAFEHKDRIHLAEAAHYKDPSGAESESQECQQRNRQHRQLVHGFATLPLPVFSAPR